MSWLNIIVVISIIISFGPLVGMGGTVPNKAVGVPLLEDESTELFDFDLNNLVLEFGEVEEISLKQAWLPAPEPGFNTTMVQVAWRPKSLYVFARLRDSDIGSCSTHYNQRMWELGDVFESFLRFERADVYYEFHVSPNNHVMQLCFGLDLMSTERQHQLPDFFMPKQIIESKVWVEDDKDQWYVLLMIPAYLLKPSGVFATGDLLEFSFGRYDFSHTSKTPLLSSSSDHKELDFHRREDWGILRLEGSDD